MYRLFICIFFCFRFFDLFEKCGGYKNKKLKLKKPKQLQVNKNLFVSFARCSFITCCTVQLRCISFVYFQIQEVLDIARQLLVEIGQNNDSEIEESKAKLEQLKTVLEMYVLLHIPKCLSND